MPTATFWKQTDSTDLRAQAAIHAGEGTIPRRRFFREQSELPVKFDVWELAPGVDHGLANTGSEPLRLVLLFGKPRPND